MVAKNMICGGLTDPMDISSSSLSPLARFPPSPSPSQDDTWETQMDFDFSDPVLPADPLDISIYNTNQELRREAWMAKVMSQPDLSNEDKAKVQQYLNDCAARKVPTPEELAQELMEVEEYFAQQDAQKLEDERKAEEDRQAKFAELWEEPVCRWYDEHYDTTEIRPEMTLIEQVQILCKERMVEQDKLDVQSGEKRKKVVQLELSQKQAELNKIRNGFRAKGGGSRKGWCNRPPGMGLNAKGKLQGKKKENKVVQRKATEARKVEDAKVEAKKQEETKKRISAQIEMVKAEEAKKTENLGVKVPFGYKEQAEANLQATIEALAPLAGQQVMVQPLDEDEDLKVWKEAEEAKRLEEERKAEEEKRLQEEIEQAREFAKQMMAAQGMTLAPKKRASRWDQPPPTPATPTEESWSVVVSKKTRKQATQPTQPVAHTMTLPTQEPIKSTGGKIFKGKVRGKKSAELVCQTAEAVREDGFKDLADKEKQRTLLAKTKMCRSITDGVPCPHTSNGKVCRFAHSIDELAKSECFFGTKCRFTRLVDGVVMNNNKADKVCQFWHPNETDESYGKRLGIKVEPKQPKAYIPCEFVALPSRPVEAKVEAKPATPAPWAKVVETKPIETKPVEAKPAEPTNEVVYRIPKALAEMTLRIAIEQGKNFRIEYID